MPVVAPPTLTPPGLSPDRSDRATFTARSIARDDYIKNTQVPQLTLALANVFANATDAATTAGASATSAGTATTQAGNAATSAGTATTQAGTATTQATASGVSATASANSAVQASKLNLGNKTSEPTLDNQGAALLAGATYYDTVLSKWRVWTGSVWGDGISSIAGVSSVNGASGAVTVQPTLVSGTNIKTVNGLSVMGSGGLAVGDVTLTGVQTLTNKTISGASNTITPDGINSVGFLAIPQNSQSVAYTAVLADSGKHILHPTADTTARIFTIPANASVAYPIGTAITFVNQVSAGVLTIAIITDVMRLAGAGTTGSRTLAANGVATAIKLTATEWIISGGSSLT